MFSVTAEAQIFLWSVLCGMIIMVIYDIFSATGRCSVSVLVCSICDGVFTVVSAAVMIFVIFSVANGYVRTYEFIGAFLGGALYKITLGRFMSSFILKIINIILLVFSKIFKFLLTPVRFMYKIIYSTIGVMCKSVQKVLFGAKKKLGNIFHTITLSLKKT